MNLPGTAVALLGGLPAAVLEKQENPESFRG